MRRFALPLLLMSLASTPVAAQDRVTLRGTGGQGQIIVSGTILEYTGRGLAIQGSDQDRIRRLVPSEIISISTRQLAAHQQGTTALRQGDWDQALQFLTSAFTEESRPWVRREILAGLVAVDLGQNNIEQAGLHFLQITQDDEETPHFHLAPLAWTSESADVAFAAVASEWLNSRNDVARLLGASWLLGHGSYHSRAEEALNQLARSANLPLQRHAQWQLRRRRSGNSDPIESEVRRWERQLDTSQPVDLAGPCLLLAQSWEQLGNPTHALALQLRAGLSGSAHRQVVIHALERALSLAEQIGDPAAAQVAAQELAAKKRPPSR